jgi:hypothetical protein
VLGELIQRNLFLAHWAIRFVADMGRDFVLVKSGPTFPTRTVLASFLVTLCVLYRNFGFPTPDTPAIGARLEMLNETVNRDDCQTTATRLKLKTDSGTVSVQFLDRNFNLLPPAAAAEGASVEMMIKLG